MTGIEDAPFALNALLYFLNYVEDIENDPVIPNSLIKQIQYKYRPELVKGMCDALKWARAHPNFDFSGRLPTPYENDQAVIYLTKLDAIFEKEGIFRQCERL